MRVDGSTRYVGAARNEAIDRINRIERAKRIQKITKKDEIKPVGYYEKRGVKRENETPEEAFRREIAEMAKSPVYAKLQKTVTEKKEEEKKENKTQEESELDQDERD